MRDNLLSGHLFWYTFRNFKKDWHSKQESANLGTETGSSPYRSTPRSFLPLVPSPSPNPNPNPRMHPFDPPSLLTHFVRSKLRRGKPLPLPIL